MSEGEAGYRLGRRDWEAGERSVFGGVERVYVWPGGAAEGDVREGGDVWQEVTRVVIFDARGRPTAPGVTKEAAGLCEGFSGVIFRGGHGLSTVDKQQ